MYISSIEKFKTHVQLYHQYEYPNICGMKNSYIFSYHLHIFHGISQTSQFCEGRKINMQILLLPCGLVVGIELTFMVFFGVKNLEQLPS